MGTETLNQDAIRRLRIGDGNFKLKFYKQTTGAIREMICEGTEFHRNDGPLIKVFEAGIGPKSVYEANIIDIEELNDEDHGPY